MAVVAVECNRCGSKKTVKNGISHAGSQRYVCRESGCGKSFQLHHRYKAYAPGIKERIVDMALNGSGVRDTSRVLSIAVGTVLTTLKKKPVTLSKST